MTEEQDDLGSPFARFCNTRLENYMCAGSISIPTRMLVLGVEDEGQDAYYFARHGFVVTAIDREFKPENQPNQPNAKFFKLSLADYFKSVEAKQGHFHAVYCRILHKLSEGTREVVLRDSFYLLRTGGWLLLDLEKDDTPSVSEADEWKFQLVHQQDHEGFVQSIFQR